MNKTSLGSPESGLFITFALKNDTAMAHDYNQDSVQEIVSWAKSMLQNKTYPQTPFQLNKSAKILDCTHFLDAMIATIEGNWENPTFHSTIEQLWEFREKIEENSAETKQ